MLFSREACSIISTYMVGFEFKSGITCNAYPIAPGLDSGGRTDEGAFLFFGECTDWALEMVLAYYLVNEEGFVEMT